MLIPAGTKVRFVEFDHRPHDRDRRRALVMIVDGPYAGDQATMEQATFLPVPAIEQTGQ